MTHTQDRTELERRLYREIAHERLGMLGLVGGQHRHMQPMTAFCDERGGPIWFFSRNDTDLARDAGGGAQAMFCLMTKDRGFIACIGGALTEDRDRGKIDKYWNPVAMAWFPDGVEDPALTLLRLDPEDAEIWVSHANPIRFAFDIAKAAATHNPPDLGDRAHLRL